MTPAQPFTLPRTGTVLRNRAVLAAMTNKQSHPDGTLSDAEIRWLLRRAEGGFGVVTTAATHVHPSGKSWEGEMGVWGDHQLPGLTRLAEGLRARGAVSLAQIFHGGLRAPRSLTGQQPVSASDVPARNKLEAARALTHAEIEELIEAFGQAAARCERAGFDGVEIHGAHGYLPCQFLGATSNQRTDQWGGDLQGRSRFLRAVVERVRACTGPEFLVCVRFSPEIAHLGVTVEESLTLARWMATWPIDVLHLSCWNVFTGAEGDPEGAPTLTRRFREVLPAGVPLLSTGSVWTTADAAFVQGEGADLVGVGRVAIGHPDWASHLGDPDYAPARPPFTPAQLEAADLSPVFVDYMRLWKDFVTDGRS